MTVQDNYLHLMKGHDPSAPKLTIEEQIQAARQQETTDHVAL